MSEIAGETLGSSRNAAKLNPLRFLGLGVLFLILVCLFTLTKIPETRITSLLQSYVQSALDPYEIYLTDRGRSLSLFTGIKYTLDHPSLELADQTRIDLDDLEVRPKLLSLFTGRFGAKATLHQSGAELVMNAAASRSKIESDLDLKDIDLGKFGVLGFAGLKGSGLISGKISVEGTVTDFASFNGIIDLKLKKFKLDEQRFMGFALPETHISEGTILIEIKNGKLVMKTVQLGRQTDDLNATLTGDVTLNRNLNASALNLRAVFAISDKLRGALSLLEGLIAPAKQSDGHYAYKMTGPLGQANAFPDPQK
jgi:type II secretion system protein N